MNDWITKLYIGVTIGGWIKRILIATVIGVVSFILYYYFNVHLPMMQRGMHVN